MRTRSALTRLGIPLAAGVAVLGMTAGPASAADVPVSFACQATPPIGGTQTFTMDGSIDATAPATAASGSSFSVSLATDPITVPASVGGNTVNSLSNLKLYLPVPTGATLTGESLSGGSGVPGTTVAVSGGKIVMSVPGPIAGGSTFQLPELDLAFTAGAPGSVVQTRIAGTSYSDPGLTGTGSVHFVLLNVNVPTACYVPANPTLTSTTVI